MRRSAGPWAVARACTAGRCRRREQAAREGRNRERSQQRTGRSGRRRNGRGWTTSTSSGGRVRSAEALVISAHTPKPLR